MKTTFSSVTSRAPALSPVYISGTSKFQWYFWRSTDRRLHGFKACHLTVQEWLGWVSLGKNKDAFQSGFASNSSSVDMPSEELLLHWNRAHSKKTWSTRRETVHAHTHHWKSHWIWNLFVHLYLQSWYNREFYNYFDQFIINNNIERWDLISISKLLIWKYSLECYQKTKHKSHNFHRF